MWKKRGVPRFFDRKFSTFSTAPIVENRPFLRRLPRAKVGFLYCTEGFAFAFRELLLEVIFLRRALKA